MSEHHTRAMVIAAVVVVAISTAWAAAPVDANRMADLVKVLSNDDFQGRAPGSAGEEKSVAYHIERRTRQLAPMA